MIIIPSSQSNSYRISVQSQPAALELVQLSSLDNTLCNVPLTKPTLEFCLKTYKTQLKCKKSGTSNPMSVLRVSDTRSGGGCFFFLEKKRRRKGSFSQTFSLTLHSTKEFFFLQQLLSTRRFDPETRTRAFFGYTSKLSNQTYLYLSFLCTCCYV